ncbi:hypothetical protein [Deinococcus sp. S9]|uniref:hypothetical protein n=1 Tax=Deinococcus sp. S9 TaxID=2545754 RepID=UPI0010560E63|nr:hypothetical protein [Deinococcus sp. S9]TDE85579.1 hypothetical protein E0686_11245 [Deinococcus sp. S9]
MLAPLSVQPHPSGCGTLVLVAPGVHYRLWRDPGPRVREIELDENGEPLRDPMTGQILSTATDELVPICQGYETRAQPYLDWDVPVNQPVTYWLETGPGEDGPWTEVARETVTPQPELAYSVLEDGITMDALNVRDAIAVFFSTRLAQLAREGRVIARKPEWKLRFPMTVAYDFEDANLPLGAVGMSYGTGTQGDLGWNMTEEDLKFSLTFVAKTREERDSITMAIRGLLQELDWFLGDMGCVNTCAGEMTEGYQNVVPVLYSLELAIGTTSYIWHTSKDFGWRLLPITWLTDDAGLGVIVSPLPRAP